MCLKYIRIPSKVVVSSKSSVLFILRLRVDVFLGEARFWVHAIRRLHGFISRGSKSRSRRNSCYITLLVYCMAWPTLLLRSVKNWKKRPYTDLNFIGNNQQIFLKQTRIQLCLNKKKLQLHILKGSEWISFGNEVSKQTNFVKL